VIQETFANAFQGAPNQLHRIPKDVSAEQITAFSALGERLLSPKALYRLIEVALLYLEGWLQGQGAAAIYHLMEDAATAEIARTQLFQWLRATPPPRTEDGQGVSVFLYESYIRQAQKAHSHLSSQAVRLLQDLLYATDLIPLFTTYAYERYLS